MFGKGSTKFRLVLLLICNVYVCRICLCLIIAIKYSQFDPLHSGQVTESVALVLAEETAKIYSVLDKEDFKDRFLHCDELEEDETVIDDD